MWRPRRDSNARARFRRAALYPLSYGGMDLFYSPTLLHGANWGFSRGGFFAHEPTPESFPQVTRLGARAVRAHGPVPAQVAEYLTPVFVVAHSRDHLDAPPLAVLPPRFDIDDVRTCVRYIQSNKPWENHAGAPYWRVPESMHRRMRNNPHCATVDSDSSAKMGDMYGGGRRNSSAWRPCKTQRCAGSMKREALFRAVSKREGPGDRPKTGPSVSEPVEMT